MIAASFLIGVLVTHGSWLGWLHSPGAEPRPVGAGLGEGDAGFFPVALAAGGFAGAFHGVGLAAVVLHVMGETLGLDAGALAFPGAQGVSPEAGGFQGKVVVIDGGAVAFLLGLPAAESGKMTQSPLVEKFASGMGLAERAVILSSRNTRRLMGNWLRSHSLLASMVSPSRERSTRPVSMR